MPTGRAKGSLRSDRSLTGAPIFLSGLLRAIPAAWHIEEAEEVVELVEGRHCRAAKATSQVLPVERGHDLRPRTGPTIHKDGPWGSHARIALATGSRESTAGLILLIGKLVVAVCLRVGIVSGRDIVQFERFLPHVRLGFSS